MIKQCEYFESSHITVKMDKLSWPPVPTAEIPLLDGLRLKIITSLTRDDSYYGLSLLFPDMIKQTAGLPQWLRGGKDLTFKCLRDVRDKGSRTWLILHCIPRELLVSACLGTIAFDFHKIRDRPKTYGDTGGLGVYILGICVAGRAGAWLTASELQVLIDNLRRYIQGYHAYCHHGNNPPNVAACQLRDFVSRVDNAIGSHDSNSGPRFIDKDSVLPSMAALVKSLELRRVESLRHDPSGQTPLVQGPQYVGCSTSMSTRTQAYNVSANKSSLKKANKAYGLIVCLMSEQVLEPVAVTQPAVRLYDNSHLPAAEVLIAAMTNCYITQDGLNRTEAGGQFGRATAADLRESEDYVMARETFLHDNLVQTCADLNARNAFIQEFTNFEPLLDVEVHNDMTGLDEWLDEMRRDTDDLLHQRDEYIRQMQRMREDAEQLSAEVQVYKDLEEILSYLQGDS